MATKKTSKSATGKKAATKEYEIDHQRLESLVNSMADGVLSTNEKGEIVLYNGAALNVLDVNAIQKGDPIENVLKLTNENKEPLDVKLLTGLFVSNLRFASLLDIKFSALQFFYLA